MSVNTILLSNMKNVNNDKEFRDGVETIISKMLQKGQVYYNLSKYTIGKKVNKVVQA